MERALPETPFEWLEEICLAIEDAADAIPFGELIGETIDVAELFHLAPAVCLKFRGMDYHDEDLREKVTNAALVNYVANTAPERVDRGLAERPLLAFALCYLTAHFALDLIDEQEADAVLTYCEDYLD